MRWFDGREVRLDLRLRTSCYGLVKKTAKKMKRVLDHFGGGAYNSTPEHGARHFNSVSFVIRLISFRRCAV